MEFLNIVYSFLIFILAFFVVLALAYITTRFLGGFNINRMNSRNIKVLETMHLMPQKYMQLIEVDSKIYLVAITKERVELIDKFNKEEINLENIKKQELKSFNEIFNGFCKKDKK